MKAALVFLCVCVAYAAAAPEKRFLLDDIAGEASKILVCEGKSHEEGCKMCCESTVWYVNAEKTACNAACNILPNKADYSATTLVAYTTYAPYTGGK